MNAALTFATATRVIRQLAADRRTIALIVAVPALLLTLLYFVYDANTALFSHLALLMLGVFPMLLMFIITSITMQRERSSGTLERLLTTRLSRLDLLAGYGLGFAGAALVQSLVTVGVCFLFLGVTSQAPVIWVFLLIPLTALVGVASGLMASAFARTEFQAVQFMPVFIGPQFFLCGLLVPRDQLPSLLRWISEVLPMSYAVDALKTLSSTTSVGTEFLVDCLVLVAFILAFLTLAALTMPRQTR